MKKRAKQQTKQSLRQKETNNSIKINWHQVRLIIIILEQSLILGLLLLLHYHRSYRKVILFTQLLISLDMAQIASAI